MCPMQHVLRYHLLLDTMANSARKQLSKGSLVEGEEWVREFLVNVR